MVLLLAPFLKEREIQIRKKNLNCGLEPFLQIIIGDRYKLGSLGVALLTLMNCMVYFTKYFQFKRKGSAKGN